MSARILSGRVVRDHRTADLIRQLKDFLYTPKLTIIQVGSRPDSSAYVRTKRAFAEKVGVEIDYIHLPESVSQEELAAVVQTKNRDGQIQGIIVQLPLPAHIDRLAVIDVIDPHKDIDGLTTINQELLAAGDSGAIIPATARGIDELLEYYSVELKGKKVAVVGRSRLVGTPVAWICKHKGAEVIVCHSQTPDLAQETVQADIVIVAVGKPGLIGPKHLKSGAVVVDVGINRLADGSLVGDVDAEGVEHIVSAITLVPGGVGQMTVLALFENLIDACKK